MGWKQIQTQVLIKAGKDDSFSKSLGAPYHFQLPFILDFSTAVWLEILELPQGSRAQLGTDCREHSLLLKMK